MQETRNVDFGDPDSFPVDVAATIRIDRSCSRSHAPRPRRIHVYTFLPANKSKMDTRSYSIRLEPTTPTSWKMHESPASSKYV